jgi:hypothetical protein
MTNGTRRWWGVSVTPRPLFTPGKYPVPIVQEARWAPGPVWTGAENLAFTGIRSPDRPARSQSLYRLRNAAHDICCWKVQIWKHTVQVLCSCGYKSVLTGTRGECYLNLNIQTFCQHYKSVLWNEQVAGFRMNRGDSRTADSNFPRYGNGQSGRHMTTKAPAVSLVTFIMK